MSNVGGNVKTPFFSFGFTKSENKIIIKEGQSYLLKSWCWRCFCFIKKLITIKNGKPTVTRV